ncbi:synaptonemal complex protein 2-like isoform X2 [Kryptolebias marmoratus]|uniref:synaptonemal complex protein 2-like isoform X2 n=1 Tax=Kryptolebias marmoratus TaxID=37003 RepID=UPI0018ACCD64|nr:synaptonemal complex protein 2-like isoform X2 [Kryptolebias marmoratus]
MFELQVDDCLLRGDSTRLVSMIHHEGLSSSTLNRLNHLVTKELSSCGFSRVLVLMKSLVLLSENKDDLQKLICLELTTKVMLWFEAVRDLLTSDLCRSSTPLFTLTEEFFDYFLLLGQASLSGPQISVVLLQLARFSLESQIHFPLRLEAIRTFNSILESLSRDQRRPIQNDENLTQILSQMAAAVLTVGDYELQVSLSEALCRLTPRRDREQRTNQWFSSHDISSAFCDIRDADFEVDCRCFLNFVNRYHGDQRRVYTFPCLRVFFSSIQLFRPKDDKLDEFWIDFNVGSGCVSFFIDNPQGLLWGSIHLLKEDVDHYTLQVEHDEMVLRVKLTNPIMHQDIRGQTVELSFSCEHQQELEEAAGRVFNKIPSSPQPSVTGGTVQTSPFIDKHMGQSYSRKKPPKKSQLRGQSSHSADFSQQLLYSHKRTNRMLTFISLVLPLSSPSSEEDSSTPKDVLRKRKTTDLGYQSDQTESVSAHKKKAEPQKEEEEESYSTVFDHTPEGMGPTVEEGLLKDGPWTVGQQEQPGSEQWAEPESQLTSDITTAFQSCRAQLEQHFTKAEAEVLLSLKKSQQHVSSLLTAVHQHRFLLLQQFENGVSDQLKQLEENSSNLNAINTQILKFFQSMNQQLGSFCEDHLQKSVWFGVHLFLLPESFHTATISLGSDFSLV